MRGEHTRSEGWSQTNLQFGSISTIISKKCHHKDMAALRDHAGARQPSLGHAQQVGLLLLGPHPHQLARSLPPHARLVAAVTLQELLAVLELGEHGLKHLDRTLAGNTVGVVGLGPVCAVEHHTLLACAETAVHFVDGAAVDQFVKHQARCCIEGERVGGLLLLHVSLHSHPHVPFHGGAVAAFRFAQRSA